MYVAPSLIAPCILGLDFLARHKISVHPHRGCIELSDGTEIAFCSRRYVRNMLSCIHKVLPKLTASKQGRIVTTVHKPLVQLDSTLTESERARVRNFVDDMSYCFAKSPSDLGCSKNFFHRLRPKGKAFRMKAKAMSPSEINLENDCIHDMEERSVVRPGNGPWASRSCIVRKKDGKPRFCVNFCRLNSQEEDDAYPLPRAPDLLNAVGNATWFSKLDAQMGYWQVRIHPDDIQFTGVITHRGLYEFLRMPFGLKNAPRTYQHMMDHVLRRGRNKFCVAYIDDVLVYSDTLDEHLEHVRQVMQWMFDEGLLLRPDKCSIAVRETEFLGHILSRHGIKMCDDKIKRILDLKRPSNVKELQSLLGVAGYYRKFIKDYGKLVAPLTELTKKSVPFVWSTECESRLSTLKNAFRESIPLTQPDYTKQFFVDTDASDVGIGAVLQQKDSTGRERPCFFASRKLSPQERKWPVRDKEGLAIVWALQQFRHHILGSNFVVRTDHASLQWLMKAETGRLARWAIILSEYQPFIIKYRSGEMNKVADALSRVYADSEFLPDIAFACATQVTEQPSNPLSAEVAVVPQPDTATPFVQMLKDALPTIAELVQQQRFDDFCLKRFC